MIGLPAAQRSLVDALLASPVVDARLELTSYLGGERLATLTPSAGTIAWDSSERRGKLDVDAPTAATSMHPRHPLGNFGQVLEAAWVWPQIGVSVPCGRWLVSEPASRRGRLWQVSADPEGPARLARSRWWEPVGRVISGPLGSQISAMVGAVGVRWSPAGPWGETTPPPTECAPGGVVTSDLQKVLDFADVEMRPARLHGGVEMLRRVQDHAPVWEWTPASPAVTRIEGTPSPELVPNRVTVWCEEDKDGARTVRGWSEPLYGGPRRWGGPYGQVPYVVRLDAPASVDAMKTQARQMLRRMQSSAASVRVEMRADPRIEVGDVAHIASPSDDTDCIAQVTSVSLNAGTGLGVVECSAISGRVAGVPATTLDS